MGGEKFGYYGENLVEKTRINQMLMRIIDLRADFKNNVMFSQKSSENKIKFANFGLAVYVGQFENCFKIWGCKYLCSKRISVADILAFQILDILLKWKPSLLDGFDDVKKWFDTMTCDEKIKDHREKLNNLPFTVDYDDWFENSNGVRGTPIYENFKLIVEKNKQYWGTPKTGMNAEF